MIIQHGVPKHDFYGIVLPPSYIVPSVDERAQDYTKPIHEFRDPFTNEFYKAQVYGVATLTVQEFIYQQIPSYLAYGVPPQVAVIELQRRYREIRETQKLRYIVLKKL